MIERLKMAWDAACHAFFGEEWPPNMGHRYAIKTLDTNYYADEIKIIEMTGYPEWWVSGPGYRLHCTRIEGAVLYDYELEPRVPR
jgi:hypothetical protein